MEMSLERVKSVQSYNKDTRNIDVIDVVIVSLLLTLNIFHTLFECFHCLFWTDKYRVACFIIQTINNDKVYNNI